MVDFVGLQTVAIAIGALLAVQVLRFLVKGYQIRSKISTLPGPPHSMLWGHLKVMSEMMQDVPPKVHPHALPRRIKEKYNIKTNYFYIDTWPAFDPLMFVFDPEMAQQITVEHTAPKAPIMKVFLRPLTGPNDMVSSDGPFWKKWRSIMNPGFAASHLMTLVTGIVDDSLIFCEKMTEHAKKGEVFRLEEDATRLTVDIIGKVTMDLELNTQRGDNELVRAMRDQAQLVPNGTLFDPLEMYWPMGIYKRWRNSRIMTRYIGNVLDERFARAESTGQAAPRAKKERKRAVIDLALDSYQTQYGGGQVEKGDPPPKMDAEFRRDAITQIRTFIFAGHDTTSSTICYAFYLLQKHPEALAKLREEHDDVLGDVDETPQLIKQNPHIINKLTYTLCVVKEVLRLFPPVSGNRTGDPGFMLRDPKTGESLPTEGFMVSVNHYTMHRDTDVWGPDAQVFDPSRFLPENESKQAEGAWRPFEKGPRNCIGQELALIESRVILALTARRFDFKPAYDSLHELKDDGSLYSKDESWRVGRQDLDGEEAYQILIGAGKPREGMPMRVKKLI